MERKGLEDKKKQVPISRRAILEKDVVHLQTRLHDEKTLRMGLEQALGEASDPCTPQDVSAGLAPQAQDLITEIVSLQKEVSHLEQHVLSLYRKVFDQRLSTHQYGTDLRSSEAQEPSIVISQSSYHVSRFRAEQLRQTKLPPSSPQHRHPGSVAMQGFKRLHSSTGAGQVKTQHRSLLNDSFYCVDKEPESDGEPQGSTASPQVLQSQMSPAIQVKILKPSSSSSPVKVDTKQTPKKTSEDVVEPSSKTPNQLAEELVRCMAAIYCKLANPPLPKFSSLSPSSSSSSTTTHESSHEFSNLHGSWSPGSQTDNTSSEMDGCIMPDPYSVKDVGGEDVGPYCSMVEVPWICVDKDRLTYATQALHNFRLMVEQLEKVDPRQMTHEQKLAFWINIYNALMMHAYLAYGIPQNRLKRLNLLQKAAYKVGAYSINAQTIEHSILGCPSNRTAPWLQAFLKPGTMFKVGDERQAYALQTPEPAVCFALCCGGHSDPAVRVYTAKNVWLELEVAKREFLQASVRIHGSSKVLLPKILEWYLRALVINSSTSLLEWVCQNVPGKLEAQIQHCLKLNPHKNPAHCLRWVPYSFGFRYIFVPDLAHRNPILINDSALNGVSLGV
ncbi:hypothetical protein BDL97_11G105500 [Sphagnum fallax]|nr:hypothetical protein BDL97_11G105500 [Sphagnum fallax]